MPGVCHSHRNRSFHELRRKPESIRSCHEDANACIGRMVSGVIHVQSCSDCICMSLYDNVSALSSYYNFIKIAEHEEAHHPASHASKT